MYIGGKQARPDSGYSQPIFSPKGKLLGHVGIGNRKDIRNAVEAAHAAKGWAKATAWNRAQVLYYVAENLSAGGRVSLMDGLSESARALMAMTRAVCYAIIVVALVDFVYQRRSKIMDLKMTKQEVKDERRSTEGDEETKRRTRQLGRQIADHALVAIEQRADRLHPHPRHRRGAGQGRARLYLAASSQFS